MSITKLIKKELLNELHLQPGDVEVEYVGWDGWKCWECTFYLESTPDRTISDSDLFVAARSVVEKLPKEWKWVVTLDKPADIATLSFKKRTAEDSLSIEKDEDIPIAFLGWAVLAVSIAIAVFVVI